MGKVPALLLFCLKRRFSLLQLQLTIDNHLHPKPIQQFHQPSNYNQTHQSTIIMSSAPVQNQVNLHLHPNIHESIIINTSTKAVQDTGKPHGKNITEVDSFDGNAPNASGAEIGSKDDPSRVAINRMQETDVPSSGVPGDRKNTIDNENKFSATGGDTSA